MTRDEADNNLRNAILEHAKAYEMDSSSSELLDEYAVVATWQPVEERYNRSYTLHFHTEHIPAHVATGLFTIALHILVDDEE